VADVTDAKYSIGYAANPLVFGLASGIDVARLRNAAGNYEFPALGNITDAAASRLTIPPQGDGFQYLITWPSAAYRTAYPVSYYSYGIVPENPSGPPAYQPAGVSAFVSWILSSAGQAVGADLGFAPLPSTVINYDLDLLNALP
jgi:ABC-type phosphate transport system substrate-binding protein